MLLLGAFPGVHGGVVSWGFRRAVRRWQSSATGPPPGDRWRKSFQVHQRRLGPLRGRKETGRNPHRGPNRRGHDGY